MTHSKSNRGTPFKCSAAEKFYALQSMEKQASCYKADGGFFEITLNLPRSSYFVGLVSDHQKQLYSSIWENMKNIITPDSNTDYTYEFCKSGHVHLHGYIAVEKPLIPVGAIADIVKRFIKVYNKIVLPRKACDRLKYNQKSMFYVDSVYKSPAILVRYTAAKDTERQQYWIEYIYKTKLNLLDIDLD